MLHLPGDLKHGEEYELFPKEVLTVKEAAELLEVSVWTVSSAAHKGELPARKVGRAWRFSRKALIDWLGS